MSLGFLWCKSCKASANECQAAGCDNCARCGTDTTREAAMGERMEERDDYNAQAEAREQEQTNG
jgi:hypothetical protein